MEEINRLEKYINNRNPKGRKWRTILIVFFILLGISAVFLWGYIQFNSGRFSSLFEKTKEEIEIVSPKNGEIETSILSPNTHEKEIGKKTNQAPSLIVPKNKSSLPSLLIEGEFVVGKAIDFIIGHPDGNRHEVDFGDGDKKAIKNRTQHTYLTPDEYKITFKTKEENITLSKTILIGRKTNENASKNFEKIILAKEKKENLKAKMDSSNDKNAHFPGGTESLMAYLQTHIGNVSAYNGRILVQIDISNKGKVSAPKILDGINDKINNEVLKAFKGMPDWIPAMKNGKHVESEYKIPVYLTKEI